jgi:hypothetical protein
MAKSNSDAATRFVGQLPGGLPNRKTSKHYSVEFWSSCSTSGKFLVHFDFLCDEVAEVMTHPLQQRNILWYFYSFLALEIHFHTCLRTYRWLPALTGSNFCMEHSTLDGTAQRPAHASGLSEKNGERNKSNRLSLTEPPLNSPHQNEQFPNRVTCSHDW